MVRQLPEGKSENVMNKVNALLKDGLKMKITVKSAERKQSKKDNTPGIVVAKCASVQDRAAIMGKKKSLKDTRQYKDVMIEYYKSQEQLSQEASLRTLVKTVAKDTLTVRNGRIVPKKSGSEQSHCGQGSQAS